MGKLFNKIRKLVTEEKYLVGQHASERLEERGIMQWQVVAGLTSKKTPRPPCPPRPLFMPVGGFVGRAAPDSGAGHPEPETEQVAAVASYMLE